MSSEKTSNDELVDSIDGEDMPSVDDFIRELEEKEKDLHISSDLVIEVGDSSVEHDNIHDHFISAPDFEARAVEVTDETDDIEDLEEVIKAAEESESDPLTQQIEDLIDERDELMGALRRQKIDFENYRSRTERDRSNTFNNIVSGLAGQILPVIDNLERALDTVGEPEELDKNEARNFVEGIVLVSHQMSEVLLELGIESIRSVGEAFDPNCHEAVDCVPTSEVPPNTIVEELLRGYRIGDRVIRHSMVKVSEPPVEASSSPAESASETSPESEDPAE